MSLGILGDRSPRVLRGLGAEPPPDPWCWKAAGYPWGAEFDACHGRSWKTCDGKRYEAKLQNKIWTTAQFDDCVNLRDNTDCNCPAVRPGAPATTTPTAAVTGLTMGNKTSDPRVVALQTEINATLTRNGYAAVGTDGKLGPGTCGAAREADKFGAGLMAKYGLASVCTSFTTPVKSGGGFGPTTAPLAPPDTLSAGTGFLGMDTKTLLLISAVAAGAYVMFGGKKQKSGAKT